MKLKPEHFQTESNHCKYSGWTPEPTLPDSFNHESGAFISFGEEGSLTITHSLFDHEYDFIIDAHHFKILFKNAGIRLQYRSWFQRCLRWPLLKQEIGTQKIC